MKTEAEILKEVRESHPIKKEVIKEIERQKTPNDDEVCIKFNKNEILKFINNWDKEGLEKYAGLEVMKALKI